MMLSVKELLGKAVEQLRACQYTHTPMLDAELLLVHVLKQSDMSFDRLKLLTQPEYPVDRPAAERYMELVADRCKGKPVQYITNRQEFMGFELYVNEGVLIPRADTETVVEKVIEKAAGMEKPNIIDMCTGSGAIAVSLAMNLPSSMVWAVDIDQAAFKCCSTNVSKYGLESRIKVIESDLFENIREEGLLGNTDIIVSNPPYIRRDILKELSPNVRDYEPHLALDGGEDGLIYYRRIVRDSVPFLKVNGMLFFETGYDQGDSVRNIMKENGNYDSLGIGKDLAGYDRCVWGYRI